MSSQSKGSERGSRKPETAGVATGRYAGESADTRHQARREKLLNAGLEVIGSRGFASTSVDAVCREAGLTKRYFYEHFKNRDDLLVAAYLKANKEMLARVMQAVTARQGQPAAMIEAGLRAVFDYLFQAPARGRVVMIEILNCQQNLDGVYGEGIGGFVNFVLASSRPYYAEHAPPEAEQKVIIFGAVGSVIYIAQRWIATAYKQPKQELVNGATRILIGAAQQLGVRLELDGQPHASGTTDV